MSSFPEDARRRKRSIGVTPASGRSSQAPVVSTGHGSFQKKPGS